MQIDINEIMESFARQTGEQAKKIAIHEATITLQKQEIERLQNNILELQEEKRTSKK